MSQEDRQFLINCITTDWVARVIEVEVIDLKIALEKVLNSRTYHLLCDSTTNLTSQSPNYLYEMYQKIG